MKGFNSKTWVFGAVATILLIAIIMPSVPSASAADVNCIWPKIYTGTFDNMVVPTGADCSLNKGVVVSGSILIESGAKFTANGVILGGDISADGADMVSITGSTINGDVTIRNTNYAPTMSISSNTITGNLLLENNIVTNGMTVALNAVAGNIEFNNNYAYSFIMIGANNISGNLDCSYGMHELRR